MSPYGVSIQSGPRQALFTNGGSNDSQRSSTSFDTVGSMDTGGRSSMRNPVSGAGHPSATSSVSLKRPDEIFCHKTNILFSAYMSSVLELLASNRALSSFQMKYMSGLRVVTGLGQGGYGCVVQVVHEKTGGMFAMKSISKARLTRTRDRRRLALELKLMTEIPKSPFLNTCQAAFETTSEIFFVLDLVSGGDLFYHLAQRFNTTNSGFTEDEARVILAELVCGLQHLHGAGFVHRDIKVSREHTPDCPLSESLRACLFTSLVHPCVFEKCCLIRLRTLCSTAVVT